MAIATRQFRVLPTNFDNLLDDFVFARLLPAQHSGVSIQLRLDAEMLETGIALPCSASRRRINLIEVLQHRLDRTVHAVKVQTVESGAVPFRSSEIPSAKPLDEIHHNAISPHPGREPAKLSQSDARVLVLAAAGNETVNTEGIRPIRLEANRTKSFLLNKASRQRRARGVKFVRPM